MYVLSKNLFWPHVLSKGLGQGRQTGKKQGAHEEAIIDWFRLSDGRKGGMVGGYLEGWGVEETGLDMKMGTVDVPRVLGLGRGW